jgi:hypothetical protein
LAGKIAALVAGERYRFSPPLIAGSNGDAEIDVLAFMDFPKEHCAKICSTSPIEQLNGEIKRRTDVLGIFCSLGCRSARAPQSKTATVMLGR